MPEDMVSYEEISDSEIEENISEWNYRRNLKVKEENSLVEEQNNRRIRKLIENVTMEEWKYFRRNASWRNNSWRNKGKECWKRR